MNPRIMAAIQAPLPLRSIQFSQAENHPSFDEGCVASGARVVIVVSFVDVNNVYICDVGEVLLFCKRVCKSFLHFLAKGGNPPLTQSGHFLGRAAKHMDGRARGRIDYLIGEQRFIKKC